MSWCQTTSNKRWNNVVFSTLKFTTLNIVESTLSISTLILTTLDNVKTTMFFQRRVSQHWSKLKQLYEYDHVQKVENSKKVFLRLKKKKDMKLSTLNPKFSAVWLFLLALLILREIWRRIFAKPQNSYDIVKTLNFKNYI